MLDPRDYSSDDPRASRHEVLSSSRAPTPVSAPQASLVVTTLADVVDATDGQLSLREAIGAANDQAGSDTITFADAIRGGSVVLSLGQLVITDDLAIDGTGETIDANGKSRVLRVDGPDGGTRLDVAIDDLTILRGHVEGNDIRGGGIFADNAELTVTDSQIRFNSLLNVRQGPGDAGYSDGAGIAAVDSILTIEGSTIDSNRSAGDIASGGNSHGGGLSLRGSALYMLDSFVNNNTATGYSIADGGGIKAVSSILQIDNSFIAGNEAGKDRASTAEGDSQGGGVYLLYSSALFTDSQILNNAVVTDYASGGGIWSELGDLRIQNTTVSGNIADAIYQSTGAGIFGSDGRLEVFDSTISGNRLLGDGNVSGPAAFVSGIGWLGSLDIVNSTIADNRVEVGLDPGDSAVGGLTIYDDASITNTTITGNATPDGVGGVVIVAGDVALSNTIIAGNDGGGDGTSEPNDIAGGFGGDAEFTSNGANIFGDAVVSNAVPGDEVGVQAATLFAEIDPQTGGGQLRFNGGPTETVALRDDSANLALDAADPADAPPFDQRGLPRDATPDIGAFELEVQPGVALVVTTLDDVVDATDGQLSLREAIDIANEVAGGNEIGFAEAIRGGIILLDADLGTLMISDDLVIDGGSDDGAAGGITIDGGFGILPFEVESTTARFENLAVEGGLGFGISGSDADIAVDRVGIGRGSEYTRYGGGIRVVGGSLLVSDSVVSIYQPGIADAAAVDLDQGASVTIERSSVVGRTYGIAAAVGGEGRVTIDESTVGIVGETYARAIDLSGELLLESSFVTARSGDPGTYGVMIDGTFQITNSTISDINNRDGFNNFAIDAIGDSSGTITNSTIGGFRTTRFGYAPPPFDSDANGVRIAPTASVRFENTIVDEHIIGTIESNGANAFRDASVDGAIAGDLLGVPAENVFANVELISGTDTYAGRPSDNGGPTPTIALLDDPANPALNSADPADAPPFDQRGLPRDATPDIGSFELEVQPPPNTLPPLAEKVPLPDSEIYGAPLFLVGPSGDAEISFVDEYAAFQSSLGVYLVGPDGTIGATEWVFDRIEHSEASDLASANARPGGGPLSPGDAVLLSDLFAPEELSPGTGFGLFLAADGWALNPAAIFAGGSLEFRSDGGPASVTDTTPELVFIADNGHERLVLGDILHTIDAGSANPLSNKLNPGDTGQVTSGLLDGAFTVAFEDKPLSQNSDRDFNDALFAVDAANTAPPVVAQASDATSAAPVSVELQTLVTETTDAAAA